MASGRRSKRPTYKCHAAYIIKIKWKSNILKRQSFLIKIYPCRAIFGATSPMGGGGGTAVQRATLGSRLLRNSKDAGHLFLP